MFRKNSLRRHSMANERITFDMETKDMVIAMARGNTGAMKVIMDLMTRGGDIDPDNSLAGFGPVLSLDALNIWEDRIWILYKYVCGEDLGKMIAVLSGHHRGQLAGTTTDAINHAIDTRGDGLDVNAVLEAVQEQFPNFNYGAAA